MNITIITLERICKYPDCTPDDVIKFTEWNCRSPFPFGWGGLQYFYTDFPYVLIKNASQCMEGRFNYMRLDGLLFLLIFH